MKNMRLPDGAVRQKMMTNGESDADIAYFFGEAASAPKAAGGKPKLSMMEQIAAGKALKKAAPKPAGKPAGGGGGMSLMEQLAAGKKLKKVIKDQPDERMKKEPVKKPGAPLSMMEEMKLRQAKRASKAAHNQ
jgi:hypothetical protein